ncbi:MAG: hypothetical protein WC052_01995 [Patescibacteria group bacterium]|jgi:hypothetical protein
MEDTKTITPTTYKTHRKVALVLAILFSLDALNNLFALFVELKDGFNIFSWFIQLLPAVGNTFLCWWIYLKIQTAESRRRMKIAIISGCILGFISFIAGFVGPILFAPEADQGPLLGIIITGPLGFYAGVAGGYLYARLTSKQASA